MNRALFQNERLIGEKFLKTSKKAVSGMFQNGAVVGVYGIFGC